MRKSLSTFIKRFGWFGCARVFFYPLTTFLTTPLRLSQTLWNCRILARGGWGDYSHFSTFAGTDYLCYWTIALNLSKFGYTGHSPYMGLGNYPLTRFFHHSLFSLYPYRKASTIVLLLGMFGWLLGHLIWLNHSPPSWVFLVIFLAAVSTTFYGNTFALQNYNVLGWLFFPLGLYGLLTKNWIIAAAAWFFVSFGSFTATSIAGIISVVSAAMSFSFAPIIAFLPAGFKLLACLHPFLVIKNMKTSFLTVMKSLGMHNKGARYRHTNTLSAKFTMIYFLFIYGQFLIVSYVIGGKISVLFLTGLVIFILNSSLIMRFLDIQSVYMLIFSLATAEVLQTPDPRLLLSYWVLISPLPILIPFPFMKKVLDIVPVLAPFSVKKLKKDMEIFLAQVRPGQMVLMAFNDPEGMYQKIFNGYTALLELPIYIASEKGFHFMPDNWAVFESNYEGAPDFWGRDMDSILRNIKLWKADYVVIYQDTGTQLKPEWESAGFEILSKFSWADHEEELRGIKPYYGHTPDWWLLKNSQCL